MRTRILPRKKTQEEIDRDQDIIDTVLAIWGLLTICAVVGWVIWRHRKNKQMKSEDGVELMEVPNDSRGSWLARARAWYRSNVPYVFGREKITMIVLTKYRYAELHDPW